jgi:hypothetical protein
LCFNVVNVHRHRRPVYRVIPYKIDDISPAFTTPFVFVLLFIAHTFIFVSFFTNNCIRRICITKPVPRGGRSNVRAPFPAVYIAKTTPKSLVYCEGMPTFRYKRTGEQGRCWEMREDEERKFCGKGSDDIELQ